MEPDSQRDQKTEPRSLVVYCDGTGNEISENISNVLKLYRYLRKTHAVAEDGALRSRGWHGNGAASRVNQFR